MFIIDPNGVVRQITINDLPVGRSVDETLRLVRAFQFVEKHGEGQYSEVLQMCNSDVIKEYKEPKARKVACPNTAYVGQFIAQGPSR